MEATTKEVRQVRQLIIDGTPHQKISQMLGISMHRVAGIMAKIKSNDIEMKFNVSVEQVKSVHAQLFEAIEVWKKEPTICNLDRMNNLQAIDAKTSAY